MARAAHATRRVSRRIASGSLRTAVRGLPWGSVKMRKLAEESEALINLLSRERLHPFRTKALHRKGAHDAAIEHGMFEILQGDLGLGGEISEEAAGEGIACTRGIDHLVERQGRSPKGRRRAAEACSLESMVAEERCGPVFAVLDDESLWTHGQN